MEALKQYLKKSGTTQQQFAERIGVKQPTVWEWVHGDTLPSADSLRKISEETGISIDRLLSTSFE